MESPHFTPDWFPEDEVVVRPRHRHHPGRNRSMPDMPKVSPGRMSQHESRVHPPKLQLPYNKWYIKPEERLKHRPPLTHKRVRTQLRETFLYEGLYTPHDEPQDRFFQKPRQTPSRGKKRREVMGRLLADSSNLRVLANFKSRKQEKSKRVPAVVSHILEHYAQQEKRQRESGLRRRQKVSYKGL